MKSRISNLKLQIFRMSNFVDYVKIHCQSGHGGAGSAHLRREKYIPKGGPDGGDGGRGGHVIMKGNANEWTLLPLRYTRHVKAQRGENGGKSQLTGADGEDIYIEVPIGTIAKNEEGEVIGEILEDGQEVVLMRGGKGGLGNEHFKSATNQTPRYAQPGLPKGFGRCRISRLPKCRKIYSFISSICRKTKDCELRLYDINTQSGDC